MNTFTQSAVGKVRLCSMNLNQVWNHCCWTEAR